MSPHKSPSGLALRGGQSSVGRQQHHGTSGLRVGRLLKQKWSNQNKTRVVWYNVKIMRFDPLFPLFLFRPSSWFSGFFFLSQCSNCLLTLEDTFILVAPFLICQFLREFHVKKDQEGHFTPSFCSSAAYDTSTRVFFPPFLIPLCVYSPFLMEGRAGLAFFLLLFVFPELNTVPGTW